MSPRQMSHNPFRRKHDEGAEGSPNPTSEDRVSLRAKLTKLVPRDRSHETDATTPKLDSGNASTGVEPPSPRTHLESSVASKDSQNGQKANIIYITPPPINTSNPPERLPAYLSPPPQYRFISELLQQGHMTIRSAAGLLQTTVQLSPKTDISVRGRENISITYTSGELLFTAGNDVTKIRSSGFGNVVRLGLLVGPYVKLFLNGLLVFASDERFGKGRWEVASAQWCKFWRLEHVQRDKFLCWGSSDGVDDESPDAALQEKQ